MTGCRPIKRVLVTPLLLTIEWADGEAMEFASIWLRDNLSTDRDPTSGQRLTDIADLPLRPRIRAASAVGGTLRVDWENEATPSTFDLEWLARHVADDPRARAQRIAAPWLDGGTMDASRDFAWATFADLASDPSVRQIWLTRLLTAGIAFLSALPAKESAIFDAMSLVGRICETNYGSAFDVRSVPQPENLAYSDLGLGLHTDNPYREPVPGFQALHALVASPDGGVSVFADGFALSGHLRLLAPQAFEILTRTPVPFLFRSMNAELYAERPLIQLSCRGEVTAVHYNSRSIAPLPACGSAAEAFYDAYRRFAELLREPRFQLRYQLREGDLVLFDNQRVLHGRTAFSSAAHARHLRGCYLGRDSVYSQAALLRRNSPSQE